MTGMSVAAKLKLPQDFSLSLETSQDANWIDQLHADAFGPGRFTRAAFCVREQAVTELQLCFVAKVASQPAGTVRVSQIWVGSAKGYLLGPLAIMPQYRNCGIGGALLTQVNQLAAKLGEAEFVLLVGDQPYYGPYGYETVSAGSIDFPAPVDPARILVHCLRGTKACDMSGNVKT